MLIFTKFNKIYKILCKNTNIQPHFDTDANKTPYI